MDLIQPSLKMIQQLHNFVKNNPKEQHLSQDLSSQLGELVANIENQNKNLKQYYKEMRQYPNYLQESNAMAKRYSTHESPQKPSIYYQSISKEIFSTVCLTEVNSNQNYLNLQCLCPFFELSELLTLRLVSVNFNEAVLENIKERLKQEEQSLAKLLFTSSLVDLTRLKSLLINQIPFTIYNWIEWDQNICKSQIETLFTKSEFNSLKKLRTIPKQFDGVFGPFTILFSKKNVKEPYFQEFKQLLTTLNFTKIENIIRSNKLSDQKMLQAVILTNKIRQEEQQVLRFSKVCHSMLIWLQYLISLYFLENIFRIRNLDYSNYITDNSFEEDEVKFAASVSKFYYSQQLVINACKRILKESQRFVIYLDFTNLLPLTNGFQQDKKEIRKQLFVKENSKLIKYLFNFLCFKEIIQLRSMNSYMKSITEEYLQDTLSSLIYQFELHKIETSKLKPKFPMLYDLGFFCPLFDISYTIIHEWQRNFIQNNKFDYIKSSQSNNNQFIQKFCYSFCNLFYPNQTGNVVSIIRNLIIKTKMVKKVKDNANPFNKSIDQILYTEYQLDEIIKELAQNKKQEYYFESLSPLFHFLKQYVIIFKSLNPTFFMKQTDFDQIFDSEEQSQLTKLNQIFTMALQFMKILYHFGCLSSEKMKIILNSSLEKFNQTQKNQLASNINQDFFPIYDIFNNQPKTWENIHQVSMIISKLYDDHSILYENQIKTKIQFTPPFQLDILKHAKELLHVLQFLDFQDLKRFSLISRQANNIYKMHLVQRVFDEGNRLKELEQCNKSIIQEILNKRGSYIPQKEKAMMLMTEFTGKDISMLKSISHANQWYDVFAQPFIILFDLPHKNNQYWSSLHKYISSFEFQKTYQEFQTETISQDKILKIQKILSDSKFQLFQAERMNLSLFKLIKWLQGVLQMHQLLRRYCLNIHDFDLLQEEEQEFLKEIDRKQLQTYKAVRFVNKLQQNDKQFQEFCQQFQQE